MLVGYGLFTRRVSRRIASQGHAHCGFCQTPALRLDTDMIAVITRAKVHARLPSALYGFPPALIGIGNQQERQRYLTALAVGLSAFTLKSGNQSPQGY